MKARWDGTLVGRDEAGRSFKALLGSSARTGPVFKGGEVIDMPQGERAPMTEAEQERARIVSLIRETEAEYARARADADLERDGRLLEGGGLPELAELAAKRLAPHCPLFRVVDHDRILALFTA